MCVHVFIREKNIAQRSQSSFVPPPFFNKELRLGKVDLDEGSKRKVPRTLTTPLFLFLPSSLLITGVPQCLLGSLKHFYMITVSHNKDFLGLPLNLQSSSDLSLLLLLSLFPHVNACIQFSEVLERQAE